VLFGKKKFKVGHDYKKMSENAMDKKPNLTSYASEDWTAIKKADQRSLLFNPQ